MISFNKEEHTYTVDNDQYISVTTLLSSWFKKFDEEKVIRAIRAKPSKYDGMTDDEIKKQWETERNEAARLGTDLHENIERYFKGDQVTESIEYGYFLQFIKDVPLITKAVEWTVFHKDIKLIGTIDYVSKNKDGTIDLYDWKRSKDILKTNGHSIIPELCHIPDSKFWKYTLQLNLYKYLVEKNGEKVRRMYIVCFHPINLGYQKYHVADLDLENVLNRIRKV